MRRFAAALALTALWLVISMPYAAQPHRGQILISVGPCEVWGYPTDAYVNYWDGRCLDGFADGEGNLFSRHEGKTFHINAGKEILLRSRKITKARFDKGVKDENYPSVGSWSAEDDDAGGKLLIRQLQPGLRLSIVAPENVPEWARDFLVSGRLPAGNNFPTLSEPQPRTATGQGKSSTTAEQKVLSEVDVTETAIVEALGTPSQQTQSFRPLLRAPPRKASMLITFQTDSFQLTPSAKAALNVVARAFQSPRLASTMFSIEGHADPRGSFEDNLRLSQQRAESVMQYLVKERGIPDYRLMAVGKGSSELLNQSFPASPVNRRVTIVTRPDRP